MRLQRLDLLRYGRFTDRPLELPAGRPDLHIVFGANEAGKSTALAAIEDLLFGIPARSPYNFLHDYKDMRVGGVFEHGESSLTAIRRKGMKDTLLAADGLALREGEAALRPFLAGADGDFFKRMFSLDHVRLEKGGREILEAKGEIGQMLFAAGAGIEDLRERLAELSEAADGLWGRRKAKHRRYSRAEQKLDDAKKDLREQTLTVKEWQELKRTYEAAEGAHADIEELIEKASTESRRLSRIRRVYRDVRRKAELEKEIQDLGEVVALPTDAREVLEDSTQKESKASTEIDILSGQLEEARGELSGLTYDAALVLRAEDVEHLHEQRIEIRREKADLPNRQIELATAEQELRLLAVELDWSEETIRVLAARIPAPSKVRVMHSVLTRRGELSADVTNKTGDLEEAESERGKLQESLDGSGAAMDHSRLRAVVRTVRERGDVAGRLRRAEQEAEDAQERVERQLASLHPSVGSEGDAVAIDAPAAASVETYRDRIQDWERRGAENGKSVGTLEKERTRARKALERMERDGEVVSRDALEQVRGRRDELWGLVKLQHIENAPIPGAQREAFADELDDLAAAFEPALTAADESADRRFDKAAVVGQAAVASREIEAQQERLDELRAGQETLKEEGKRLSAEWLEMWAAASFEPRPPDDMLEWLKKREGLLEAMAERTKARGAAEVEREEEREAKESLLAELAALGMDREALESDALGVVLERADGVLSEHELQARDAAQLKKDLEDAAAKFDRNRHELDRAKKAWAAWRKEWSGAVSDLGLALDLGPDAALAQIDVIDEMRKQEGKIKELQHQRIDKIQRDITAFETAVGEFVRDVAADLTGKKAEAAVLEIEKRLEEAQHNSNLQASKRKDVEGLKKKVGVMEEGRREAREALSHLKKTAGVKTTDALTRAIERSDDLRALKTELGEALRRLEQEGDGLAVDALEQECCDVDIATAQEREGAVDEELKDLRGRLSAAAGDRTEARTAFEAIGGDDAAARAEAARQEALAEMREAAESYVLVRTSAVLLQWAMDRYRQEKQAPLLKRAGELFAMITGESFSELQTDYDAQDRAELLGVRPDGEKVRVSGMSTGTADQLYLALRVASIEDYLDRADGLPFVADDLFINFDNDRAAAGFQVLGELAKRTQVLFFTHHQHLVDIAKETAQERWGGSLSVVSLN